MLFYGLYLQIINPFYVFQIFSIILWCCDEYYIYAGCILVISLISIGVELYETRKVCLLGRSLPSVSVCLSVCLLLYSASVCLFICLCLSICLSVCLLLYSASVCLSFYLSLSVCRCMSVCLSVFVCLSVSICLSVCKFVWMCLYVCCHVC